MVQPISLFSFLFLTLHLSVSGVISATFTLVNQCNYTVWPASNGNSTLVTTGFVLKSGESSTVTVPANWQGRFWGRTLCMTDSTGNFSYITGDCGGKGSTPPATLAEFTLNGTNGRDFYDVSLVDGYNVPMVIIPVGGSNGKCNSAGCSADLNAGCPTELKVTKNKQVVGCKGLIPTMTMALKLMSSRSLKAFYNKVQREGQTSKAIVEDPKNRKEENTEHVLITVDPESSSTIPDPITKNRG